MDTNHPLLTVRFAGEAVEAGSIPVSHLLRFLANLEKALRRTGRVLANESRTPPPGNIKKEVALDLVLLTHGSPETVLGFERRQTDASRPETDFGLEVLEKAVTALAAVQEEDEALPPGCDAGVLRAWRDAGMLLSRGIAKIEIALNNRDAPLAASLSQAGIARIQARIMSPETKLRTIEGRLLMVDFKVHGARCRVHPSIGEPVLCLFGEAQREEVLENILHFVRITGAAKEDAVTGRISSIEIHEIKRLDAREGEAAGLLSEDAPISLDFWKSHTLDELAREQNVKPVTDVKSLLGGWPGDVDDGFEEEIRRIRHQGFVGD